MGADGVAPTKRLSVSSADLVDIHSWLPRRARRRAAVTAFGRRGWVLGDLTYAMVAAAVWVLLPPGHALQPPAAAAAVALFVAAAQVSVPLKVGAASLIQPAFVLMLFVVPLNAVPALVLLCKLAAEGVRRRPLRWLALTPGDCWYAVPPVVIIAFAAPGPASWSHWTVYAIAFAAGLALDLAVAAGRRASLGHGEFDLSTAITPTAIDLCLTPIGLAAAVHVRQAPGASIVTVAGVLGLATMFGRERAHRLGQQHDAFHDRLTGLANRALFEDLLDSAARRCSRCHTWAALLVLDLNRFKEVNDRRGHRCGDAVLKAFAERVRECVNETDIVARIGGDEFAILLADPTSLEAAHAVADEVREALRAPLRIPDVGDLVATASMGTALFGPGVTPARALAEADMCMYADKDEWSRLLTPA